MLGAVHPRCIRFDERADLADVQCPPSTTSLALVIARRPTSTAPASALTGPPWPDVGDHGVSLLVELDPLDHRSVVDAEQPTPYLDT